MAADTDDFPQRGDRRPHVRMLGPLTLWRDGVELALPASRKVRGLLAYLALAPRAQGRSQLCELLWDLPDDPRGELRWCLSKIRGVLDDGARRRIITRGDTVELDLGGCRVDAIEVADAVRRGVTSLGVAEARSLAVLFRGDFLEGLEIERSPGFDGWLAPQRRRFRAAHVALLEQLVDCLPHDEAMRYLERWLQLAPFDRRAHETLLGSLARLGRMRDGEEHLARTTRLFEAEGLDAAALRAAWQAARAAKAAPPAAVPAARIAMPDDARGPAAAGPPGSRRASLAVMPLQDLSSSGALAARGGSADALTHDLITRLAKLRSMFVIAQGTVFALQERQLGAEQAGRLLNVDFVVSGSVRLNARRLAVAVELAETRTARIIWSESFNHTVDDLFNVLDEMGDRIVASVASEIEALERNRAILRPPSSLDAWEALHRGLWHVYRFNRIDNDKAQHFFDLAVRLDPTFARGWAGLSFVHFQNAFQGWTERAPQIERAFETAGQSLMVDDRDPAAHWAMGRALWLRRRHDQSVAELTRAIDLSPNFALGHYTLAFVEAQAGDPHAAIVSSDHARQLSPFDPLLFGMLGARALALLRLARVDEAAEWAVRAAARPNAHAHIHAIAAFSLALAGRLDEARAHAATICATRSAYGVHDLLDAFRFDTDGAELLRRGASLIGMA